MSENPCAPTLEIEYRLLGRTGKTLFACWYDEQTLHQGVIDLSAARHPKKIDEFVDKVCTNLPNEATRESVEKLMKERVTDALNELLVRDDDGGNRAPTQATELVDIAAIAYVFRTPGADPEAFATVTENGRRRTWPVRSKGFRRWLTGKYYGLHERAPGSQALHDALNTIEARAVSGENVNEVSLRLAEREGSIWLDLADDTGNAVEITRSGWRIVPGPEVPLAFLRRRGTLPLPLPNRGGSIDELRQFVNIVDDDDWCLARACLLSWLRPGYPFPILNITGEQGSAKSTTTKVLRMLIDPHKVLTKTPPRDARDLFIAASNAWVVAFDNVSYLPPWLSDALCILATGGGFGTRELYSDDEEKLFDVMRPVMLNSIADVAERSDLVDRAVSLNLPRIDGTRRLPEKEFWSRFDGHRPRILGALLDAATAAIANVESVELESLPRMADFTQWAVAAERALSSQPGSFLEAYRDNRDAAHQMAVETSAIGTVLLDLLDNSPGAWESTVAQLLDALEQKADDRTKRRKDWPKGPRGLSGALRRLAPNLRELGVDVLFLARSAAGRRIRISTGSTAVEAEEDGSQPSPSPPPPAPASDGRVGSDGRMPHSSVRAEEGFRSDDDVTEVRL